MNDNIKKLDQLIEDIVSEGIDRPLNNELKTTILKMSNKEADRQLLKGFSRTISALYKAKDMEKQAEVNKNTSKERAAQLKARKERLSQADKAFIEFEGTLSDPENNPEYPSQVTNFLTSLKVAK